MNPPTKEEREWVESEFAERKARGELPPFFSDSFHKKMLLKELRKGDTMDRLREITQRLIDIREREETVDMEKGKLFSEVKRDKLYKQRFGTFAAYCEFVGFHRTYVYDIIRVYDTPEIREAYEDLGAMKATKIAKSNLNGHTSELVEYGKTHTASELIDRIKEIKKSDGNEQEVNDGEKSLSQLLAEQSRLLNRKSELEAELSELNGRLNELYKLVKEKSA